MHNKPKKWLGQNFLIDRNIQRKIIHACELVPSDTVVEIGSGRGELTGLIAEAAHKVFAVEIDKNLCELLIDKVKEYVNVEVINQDILTLDLSKYFSRLKSKIKVIGNIPYYISSPIIEHLINCRERITAIFLTVQKELAERVTATAGSKAYGSNTCFIQYYTEPKILFDIKKTSFIPTPKVDSSLIRLRVRTVPYVHPKNEEFFFRIIRAAFNKRRKTLKNSLQGIIAKEKLEFFFQLYDIKSSVRPEDLSLPDFVNLANL